ncbi:hypothetical protein AX15_005648, partial [Amanita polypyramis BW_CC]
MQLVLLISTALSFLLSAVLAAPTCGLVPPRSNKRASTTSNSNNNNSAEVVATAWVPGWKSDYNLDLVSWESYSHLTFSFAVTAKGAPYISLDKVDTNLLTTFLARCKSEGVGAFISVGGWTGSLYFSTNVQPDNQEGFVKAIVDMVHQYDLDGVDFDWEFPNSKGIGCNDNSADDTQNYLAFLKKLRAALDPSVKLSAAVNLKPFLGSDGQPMTDVSGFSSVLDYLAIMNYDVWGAWTPTVGPNAPLYDSCASQPQGSAESAVKAWTSANFPANKILLGVPAYGHSFSVEKSAAVVNNQLVVYAQFNKDLQPPGEGETAGTNSTDECGMTVGPSGIFNFEGLVTAGFLQNDNGNVSPASGMVYTFDNCSQT